MSTHLNSPKFVSEVQNLVNGTVPSSDNSSIDTGLVAWNKLKIILDESTTGSAVFTNAVVSTYSLVYTTSSAYIGGVLSPNGDINFIPFIGVVGQKISSSGVVSTYSLVYSTGGPAYAGGVLAPNGDVNFVPYNAAVGQKINSSGVVSTYSLVYTVVAAYDGGVLGTNGDTHFIPCSANRGQKISSAGVVSTYSLVYTTSLAYSGGVLAPNGDINFIPYNAGVGQKISSAGVVSTYSLTYNGTVAFTASAFVITSGTSRTVPTGATSMKAWVIGGGGGGGYDSGSCGVGGDGAYGGEAYKLYTVVGGATITYTVGAAGTQGDNYLVVPPFPTNGGTTTLTYGGVTITATGGAGGETTDGTGSGGDFNRSFNAAGVLDFQGRVSAVTLSGSTLNAGFKGTYNTSNNTATNGSPGGIVLYFT